MKVLLCSPYLKDPKVIQGGINMWAQNILGFCSHITSDVEIIPVSFDRTSNVNLDDNLFKRVFYGIKELSLSTKNAINVIKSGKVDVVHICTSASFSLIKDILLLKFAKKHGKKSTLHLHFGRVPQLIEHNDWEWRMLKKAVVLSTEVVAMDMQTYSALSRLGYNNVEYCPNPLSIGIMNQIKKEKDNIRRVPNKLLFIGHVIPTKGVYELVEACKMIDGYELYVVGKVDVAVKEDLLVNAVRKDNTDWIHFLGEISHDEVIRHLLSASIFVFPSYTEGFPNVILEAMACGTPIVATTVGAIPEMLDTNGTGNNGICVPPKDVDALVVGIRKFTNNRDYSNECSLNAQKRVIELYAVPVVWNKLTEIWGKAYGYSK